MNLKQIYFLGGAPCSGKSTICERLARKYGFDSYKVNDYIDKHIKEAIKRGYPMISKLSKLAWDEILSRDLNTQVYEEFIYYKEILSLVVEDIEKMSLKRPLIVEGTFILPDFIEKMKIKRENNLFLVSTIPFLLRHYRKSQFRQEIINQCENKEKAFENWMKRDIEFGKIIVQEVKKNRLNLIMIDIENTINENVNEVEKRLKLR